MNDILIDALVDLYQNGPRHRHLGLCWHVHADLDWRETELSLKAMQELFKRWPLYSGHPPYPVPGPKGQAPDAAFHAHGDMWSGEYGELRWALAEFMLRELCK